MSKIYKAFENKKAFIGFVTAGDPTKQKTIEFILTMAEAGADLIEIGIPFSDPSAEGIVIQRANIRALNAGMNVEQVFEIVEEVRKKCDVPIVFLTYVNPVFHYGYEAFFKRCNQTGVDGIIVPDMPYEESEEMKHFAEPNDVDFISLIAPTSQKRVEKIASTANGFVYIVSSMGVTGVRSEINTNIQQMVQQVKQYTNTPVAVGFGINTPEQAYEISKVADGVIVGSAIVKIIEDHGENASQYLKEYVEKMKLALTAN